MNSDNPFQRSRKREVGVTFQQRLQARYDQDEREHQKHVTKVNALAIHQRLESILRHLSPKISDAQARNYYVIHQFRPGNIQPKDVPQYYYRLGLYMKRGGVSQSSDPNYLPEADYALEFTGQSEKGTIEVKYFAKPTGTSATLRLFDFIGQLSNAEVDTLWAIFVDRSLVTDEERLRRS